MSKFEDNNEKVKLILANVFPTIDDDTLDYFASMIGDSNSYDATELKENLTPFIESYGLADDTDHAMIICDQLCIELSKMGINEDSTMNVTNMNGSKSNNEVKLLERSVILSDIANSISESERQQVDTMWGFENIRKKRNDVMEATEAGSAKYERKAANEQKKWLKELETKLELEVNDEDDDENNQISAMTLPDLSGNNHERDIQVNNVTIMYSGRILLENADLRLVYGRRYGLIGRNGIGKTTLLKHMANFDIEGFPRFVYILLIL